MTDTRSDHPVTIAGDVEQRLRAALAGKYEVEGELGAGGMAVVFRAHDVRHDRRVAVKVLREELAVAVGAQRFLREIRIAAQIQHPHVLTLIDSGEANGLLYYVMPFIEGQSLAARLKRDGALPIAMVTRLLRDIADGLGAAHRHGIVHRDVKPDNVLLADEHAMVVDFGVALAVGSATAASAKLTATGISVGSPAYMAPEQIAGDHADARADVYATGVVAYEMLAGALPFQGTAQQVMAAHVTKMPEPIGAARKDTPAELARIVMRCLAKDPEARYPTAAELLADLEQNVLAAPARTSRKLFLGMTIATAALAAVSVPSLLAARRADHIRTEVLPLAERVPVDKAFFLADSAYRELPNDPQVKLLWMRTSYPAAVNTVPAGAHIRWAMMSDSLHWIDGGVTPVDSLRLPRAIAVRLRLEKEGYRAFEGIRFNARGDYVLDSVKAPYPEMVRVNGATTSPTLVGLDHLPPVALADFRMDRKEVTNREYKAFVDAGGYADAKYWTHPFMHDGKAIAFAGAMALLKDKTGRPGPAMWEGGDFPSGQADYPVGGVTWFEAAAYAAFAGKSLPSAYHWARAAGTSASAWIIPGSNFNTGAPRPASPSGVSVFGVYDMAGTAREWVFNADGRGRNYILGGGYNDETYAFDEGYAQDPFDRSPSNGIRLVKYGANDSSVALAERPLVRASRDYTKETPVPQAVFEAYRNMYDYEHAPLDVKVISRDTTNPDWIAEHITYDAGYNHERMPADIYLPRRHVGKAQGVVMFPGDNGFAQKNQTSNYSNVIDFFIRSGRVVIVPVYKSTYERTDSLKSTLPDSSLAYRDHMLTWGKEVRRAVDVLQSRAEVDSSRIAYYGVSWGGRLGGLMPAIEPRFKAVVLIVAGYRMQRARPEVDPFNFVPHITQPVLLIGARYDDYFPVESSQRPFFNQLGTPADRKKWIVVEGGHFAPRTAVIGPALDWFDRYLGAP